MRRRKITMMFLVMFSMLSIYYVNTNKPELIDTSSEVEVTEYEEFVSTREEILAERNSLLTQLDIIIASEDMSIESKEMALETMVSISKLTYSELEAEDQILDLGYDDVLVHFDNGAIKISLLADDFSTSEFVTVSTITKLIFGEEYSVSVEIVDTEI